MTLSKGQEHLEGTVVIVREMLGALEGRTRQDDGHLAEVKEALEGVLESLQGLEDSFFLKSGLCVYFTRRLLSAAERSRRALDDFQGGEDGDFAPLNRALSRLSKAASTLADKSEMRDGVTLT